MSKTALITGITGQDGMYLSEHLLDCGYDVWGIVRRSSDTGSIDRIKDSNSKIHLRYGDMTDSASLRRIIKESTPDEIYNLAAQSHVRISFDIPEYTSEVNGSGVISLLDAVRDLHKVAKVYQASTSELYGSTSPPQNEDSPFHPRSPYGVSKLQAYWAIINYRESYDMFAAQGILFNHESPRRGENFVTRKITKSIARIKLGLQDCLYLGNLDAKRDWGFAGDYVKAMRLILQQDSPDDFVISTGKAHSVRDFLLIAFNCLGIEVESNGKSGLDEEYIDCKSGKSIVKIDERFYRPAEVDYLLGDSSKAKAKLGWKPETSFDWLVETMVNSDFNKEKIIIMGKKNEV